MLTVDHYAEIRQARQDGLSIRQLIERFGHAPKTILKILRHAEPKPYTLARPRSAADPSRRPSLRVQEAAGLLLTAADPTRWWPVVWAAVWRSRAFGRDLFLAVADRWDHARHAGGSLGQCLGEDQAADLYLWLAAEFPPTERGRAGRFGRVTRRDCANDLRDAVLTALQHRGTPAAALAVERIAAARPELAGLTWTAEAAWQATLRSSWCPPTPGELLCLLERTSRRWVGSGDDLLAVLCESLARLEGRLQGETPAATHLWNTPPGGRNRPKTRRPCRTTWRGTSAKISPSAPSS